MQWCQSPSADCEHEVNPVFPQRGDIKADWVFSFIGYHCVVLCIWGCVDQDKWITEQMQRGDSGWWAPMLSALVFQIFRLIQPFYTLYTLLYLEFWMGFGSCLCSSFSGWRKTWYQGRGMILHRQPWLTEMPGVLAPMHTSPAVNVTQLQSFCVLSALDINRLQRTKCLWKQWKYKKGIYPGLI